MIIQPKDKFSELVDLEKTFIKRDRSQAFVLNRYKKDAELLVKSNPSRGYTMLGMIACLEHDGEAMHHLHRTAIEYEYSAFTLSNYGASLDKFCLWTASAGYFVEAYEAFPTNITLLMSAFKLLALSGRYTLLAQLAARWDKAVGDKINAAREKCALFAKFCAENGVREEEIWDMVNIVEQTLSATEVIITSYGTAFVQDDAGTSYLYHSLGIPKALDVYKFEAAVDAALSTSALSESVRDKVIFSFGGEEVDEMLFTMDAVMDFEADDMVKPEASQLALIRELIDGVKP